MKFVLKRIESLADVVNLFAGAFLFFAPWVLGYATQGTAAWTAWISGIAVAAMAVVALTSFAEWEEWVESGMGAWVILSPWLIGFAANAAATWCHVVLGLAVFAAAMSEIRLRHTHGASTA